MVFWITFPSRYSLAGWVSGSFKKSWRSIALYGVTVILTKPPIVLAYKERDRSPRKIRYYRSHFSLLLPDFQFFVSKNGQNLKLPLVCHPRVDREVRSLFQMPLAIVVRSTSEIGCRSFSSKFNVVRHSSPSSASNRSIVASILTPQMQFPRKYHASPLRDRSPLTAPSSPNRRTLATTIH